MLHLIFIPALIVLSGLFSGSETALFSLSWFQRRKMQISTTAGAKRVSELLKSPRRTLATILIGNILVNVAATSIVTVAAVKAFGEAGVIISIFFTVTILLLFGEVMPKIMAIQAAEKFSMFVSFPLLLFNKIILPIRWLLQSASGAFIALFTKQINQQPFITEKELKAMVSISKKEGIIDKEEEKMIHSIFEFGHRSVDEIMTPRVDIAGCDKKAPKEHLIKIMRESKFSKIPIYEDDLDHIVGVVYTKEFMLNPKDDWHEYIKKPLFIPEAEMIDDLLIKFQSERNYIAIIIDEFGGTSGLITLEDVLEEIVGEIHDEYDKVEANIEKQKDGSYIIKGKTLVKELNQQLNINLPTEEVNTINGFMLLLFGRVPKSRETTHFKNLTFTVLDVDEQENRINKLLLTKKK